MFELFEESHSDNQWPNLNQRQRAEHLNIRCINVVLGCIRNNQLGYCPSFETSFLVSSDHAIEQINTSIHFSTSPNMSTGNYELPVYF
jgi:hypothetical protein